MEIIDAILEECLSEGILENVKKQYPEVDEKIIDEYHDKALPNDKRNLSWVIKQHKLGNIKVEEADTVKPYLQSFEKNKTKIGKGLHELDFNGLKDSVKRFADIGKEASVHSKNIVLLHDEDGTTIHQHKGWEAMAKMGSLPANNPYYRELSGHAKWCISLRGGSNKGYVSTYTANGKHPVVSVTNKNGRKYALVMDANRKPIEFRDEKDRLVNVENFLHENPSVLNHKKISKFLTENYLEANNFKNIIDACGGNYHNITSTDIDNIYNHMWEDKAIVKFMSEHKNASPEVLKKIYQDGVYPEVLSHPKYSKEHIKHMLNINVEDDGIDENKQNIAKHAMLDNETLHGLLDNYVNHKYTSLEPHRDNYLEDIGKNKHGFVYNKQHIDKIVHNNLLNHLNVAHVARHLEGDDESALKISNHPVFKENSESINSILKNPNISHKVIANLLVNMSLNEYSPYTISNIPEKNRNHHLMDTVLDKQEKLDKLGDENGAYVRDIVTPIHMPLIDQINDFPQKTQDRIIEHVLNNNKHGTLNKKALNNNYGLLYGTKIGKLLVNYPHKLSDDSINKIFGDIHQYSKKHDDESLLTKNSHVFDYISHRLSNDNMNKLIESSKERGSIAINHILSDVDLNKRPDVYNLLVNRPDYDYHNSTVLNNKTMTSDMLKDYHSRLIKQYKKVDNTNLLMHPNLTEDMASDILNDNKSSRKEYKTYFDRELLHKGLVNKLIENNISKMAHDSSKKYISDDNLSKLKLIIKHPNFDVDSADKIVKLVTNNMDSTHKQSNLKDLYNVLLSRHDVLSNKSFDALISKNLDSSALNQLSKIPLTDSQYISIIKNTKKIPDTFLNKLYKNNDVGHEVLSALLDTGNVKKEDIPFVEGLIKKRKIS